MTEVTVKLRWEGPDLMVGPISYARIDRAFHGPGWCGAFYAGRGEWVDGPYATKAEARAAVEAAVIKALGGDHEQG